MTGVPQDGSGRQTGFRRKFCSVKAGNLAGQKRGLPGNGGGLAAEEVRPQQNSFVYFAFRARVELHLTGCAVRGIYYFRAGPAGKPILE